MKKEYCQAKIREVSSENVLTEKNKHIRKTQNKINQKSQTNQTKYLHKIIIAHVTWQCLGGTDLTILKTETTIKLCSIFVQKLWFSIHTYCLIVIKKSN